MPSNKLTWIAATAVILVVAIVYWPVLHAQFIWDDLIDFQQHAWLSQGDEWKHYVLRGFNYWTNYFRPLVVGLFTLQVRLFDTAPGPMHAVSLALHLVDTLLVGILSWRLMPRTDARGPAWLPACVMLFYGLHPVLVESVAWIGCQFDQVVTLLTLCGLLVCTTHMRRALRAAILAVLFFLAACSKESAIAFPLVVVVLDWLLAFGDRQAGDDNLPTSDAVRLLLKRQWPTYAAMLAAGIAYLGFRHWALGQTTNPFSGHTASVFARLQEVCFLYLHYWRTVFWPMSGMGPIHPVDASMFGAASAAALLTDAAAICIVAFGLHSTLRKASVLGAIIMIVTVTLLPVLHIASTNFDSSLYHERYVMTGLAVAFALLPRLLMQKPAPVRLPRLGRPLLVAVGAFWLLVAVFNIRTTLPLWANNINLWRWAAATYPTSIGAKSNLLSAYIDANDYADGNALVDQLQSGHVSCDYCMLNAATLALAEHAPERAAKALEVVKNIPGLATNKELLQIYLVLTGQMLIQQGHFNDAEMVLRSAVNLDPIEPLARVWLAVALAQQGKKDQAIAEGTVAKQLLAPSDRRGAQTILAHVLQEETDSTGSPPPAK
ncbi:tetratricopeptide repeat protein [Rhodanobacter sp. DHB23]|uniref:tetratricopeptide repeat protein n=1 Tax=Rhodanobacter sp. DHB23 TaxID=2775923 RepID=UPI0017835D09|nr:tetratricopeptide repeat protein [Rhodanobacter sp. DHB23]MBD8873111.1 hypothetical protein [Rhodanobacter sp. DHB23]